MIGTDRFRIAGELPVVERVPIWWRCRREHNLDARPIGLELIGKDSRECRQYSLAHLGMRTLQREAAIGRNRDPRIQRRCRGYRSLREYLVGCEATRDE